MQLCGQQQQKTVTVVAAVAQVAVGAGCSHRTSTDSRHRGHKAQHPSRPRLTPVLCQQQLQVALLCLPLPYLAWWQQLTRS